MSVLDQVPQPTNTEVATCSERHSTDEHRQDRARILVFHRSATGIGEHKRACLTGLGYRKTIVWLLIGVVIQLTTYPRKADVFAVAAMAAAMAMAMAMAAAIAATAKTSALRG